MQRKTPAAAPRKNARKQAQQPKPGTPFSSRERMQQQQAEREKYAAADAALREACDLYRRAWNFTRENLYDTTAWTEYERTYRDFWRKSLAARSLAPNCTRNWNSGPP